MSRKNTAPNVTPINACQDTENWAMVPVNISGNRVRFGMVEIHKKRGRCSFAKGIPLQLTDFIYRAVVKLGIKDRKLIFARGTIKHRNRPVRRACMVRDLEWDLGTAIILPRALTLKATAHIKGPDGNISVRWIELVTLNGLLQVALPGKSHLWYSARALSIITGGWGRFQSDTASDRE